MVTKGEPMNKLIEIKEYVDREYLNLVKSKNRARSKIGIQTKRELLLYAVQEFESTLEEIGVVLHTKRWNKLTDDLEYIKSKVDASLKILDGTTVIPEKEKPRRRNSDYYIEVIIPEYKPDNFQRGEEPPLSSTRVEESVDEADTTSFKEHLDRIKEIFKNNSFEISNAIEKNFKMAVANDYVFPMVTAIQCIPEFHGKPEQLRPFVMQVEHFARDIPAGAANQRPLLNVVYTKLRGEALRLLPELEANTWLEMKQKLEQTFQQEEKSIGSLIREIETLEQLQNETFMDYKKKAMKLYRIISALPEHGNESYTGSTLRKHFLAGLKSRSLATAGKSQRDKTFPELLNWLQSEYEEEGELDEIHDRLHSSHQYGSKRNQREDQWAQDSTQGRNQNNNGNRNSSNGNRNNGNQYQSYNNYRNNNNFSNHNFNNNNYGNNNSGNYNRNFNGNNGSNGYQGGRNFPQRSQNGNGRNYATNNRNIPNNSNNQGPYLGNNSGNNDRQNNRDDRQNDRGNNNRQNWRPNDQGNRRNDRQNERRDERRDGSKN